MSSAIGSRIRLRRQQLHLTQAELAHRVGVHVSTVTNWETGKHFPGRYQGALEAELDMKLEGVPPEDVYTDPTEVAIWEDKRLPAAARRTAIDQIRRARQDNGYRVENPPA